MSPLLLLKTHTLSLSCLKPNAVTYSMEGSSGGRGGGRKGKGLGGKGKGKGRGWEGRGKERGGTGREGGGVGTEEEVRRGKGGGAGGKVVCTKVRSATPCRLS
jgi:hypothetical protein